MEQFQLFDSEEVGKDLKFLLMNRSDSVEQFVEEGLALYKHLLAGAMEKYDDHLISDITNSVQGEIADVILRSRRSMRSSNQKPKEGGESGYTNF